MFKSMLSLGFLFEHPFPLLPISLIPSLYYIKGYLLIYLLPQEKANPFPRTHTEFPLRSLRKNSIKFSYKCFLVLLRKKLFDKFTTILKNILFNLSQGLSAY